MKEDWTDNLKQRLEGHKAEPPANLWEGVCRQMGFETEPARQVAVRRRWYWTAAAAVLAVVGLFAVRLLHETDNVQPTTAEVITSKPADGRNVETPEPVNNTPTIEAGHELLAQAEVNHSHSSETIQTTDQKDLVESPIETTPTVNEETDHTVAVAENGLSDVKTAILTDNSETQVPLRISRKKWILGMNASGGLLAASTTQQPGRVMYVTASRAPTTGYSASQVSYARTVSESKHHLPLRFGLSVQYELTPRLSLVSGIDYTYLWSEFSIPLYQMVYKSQKLHYLGIPLGLSWRCLSAGNLSLYISGQAMLEKSLNEKPWQWSASIAAGAEYRFTSHLGIFAEPSLGYYFDDGTNLQHYYKEHPTAPSIEFGLRLHLNRLPPSR